MGNGAAKTRILYELVEMMGWHRDYARDALRHALIPPSPKQSTGARPLYGSDLMPPSVSCSTVLRVPAKHLLAPMMHAPLPLLRKEKKLLTTDAPGDVVGARAQQPSIGNSRTPDRRCSRMGAVWLASAG